MNKKLKKQLKAAFDAPKPIRKTEFMNSINFPRTTLFDFVIGQAGYIRKRVWIVSVLTAAFALFGLKLFANNNEMSFVWVISSFLPFVSLVSITEIARSSAYNMTELEMGCKYSFSNIVLARMGILGGLNAAVFLIIILALCSNGGFGLLHSGIYLLTPFLLTCSLSLFVMNRLRLREAVYVCGSISCFVSISNAFFTVQQRIAFSEKYLLYLAAAVFILLLWTTKETIKLIKGTEEIQWSLL